jgi:hypothetical protein
MVLKVSWCGIRRLARSQRGGDAAWANVARAGLAQTPQRGPSASLWSGFSANTISTRPSRAVRAHKVKSTGLTQNSQVDHELTQQFALEILIRASELTQILGQPCEFQVHPVRLACRTSPGRRPRSPGSSSRARA